MKLCKTTVTFFTNLAHFCDSTIFLLKVWDEQGKSSKDSVSINVHEDPRRLDVVEAVLNEQVTALTSARLDLFAQKIKLLLSDTSSEDKSEDDSPYHVKVIDVSSRPHSGT